MGSRETLLRARYILQLCAYHQGLRQNQFQVIWQKGRLVQLGLHGMLTTGTA